MTGKPLTSTTEFVRVVSDKKLREFGLSRGDILMVLAFKTAPVTKSDPYLFRKYAVVARFVENELQLPSEGTDYKTYVVDPRNLERVTTEEQVLFEGMLGVQYGDPAPTPKG